MTSTTMRSTRRDAAAFEQRRIEAIRLIEKEGKTQVEAAKAVGVNARTTRKWMEWHRGRDVQRRGVAARKATGRPRRLGAMECRKLQKILLDGAVAAGFSTELWTCQRVVEVVKEKFGVSYHFNHMGKLLRQLGFTPQKPARRAIERKEKEIRTWVRRQWPRIKKKPRKQGQS